MNQSARRQTSSLILGRSRWRGLLRMEAPGHLLTIGPRRTGKGTGAIVPNLLTYRGSVIVLDRDGENYKVTARARRKMGQYVAAFDPFGIAADDFHRSTFNLCDPSYIVAVRQARESSGPGAFERIVQEEAAWLSELLVKPAKTREEHWEVEARALLAGLIADGMISARSPGDADLARVRRTLTLPPQEWSEVIQKMEFSEYEFVRRTAWWFGQKSGVEQSGVRSTAQAHTHFLDLGAVAESLGSSDRDFAWGGGVSIYIILPSGIPDLYAKWARVLLSSILRSAAADHRERPDILVFLDHPMVVRELELARRLLPATSAPGIRFWLFVRDLSELQQTCGGSWRSIVANSEVIQAIGLADDATARMVSRRAGGALSPLDVLRIGKDHQLLLRRGEKPVVSRPCRYYSDPEFKGLIEQR